MLRSIQAHYTIIFYLLELIIYTVTRAWFSRQKHCHVLEDDLIKEIYFIKRYY